MSANKENHPMTYTLYTSADSGSFVVEAALTMAGAEFTKIDIDMESGTHREAEFAALNPMKQLPALALPSGEVMTESAAILIYLAQEFAGKGLAPEAGTAEQARFLRWAVFISANLYEGVLRYYFTQRYTTDETPAGPAGVKAAAQNNMRTACAVLEADLARNGPWLSGPGMTLVDVYFTMLHSWNPGMADTSAMSKLNAMVEAVRADAVIAPILGRHGL
jgi:glutathione S-transferase